MLYLDPRLRPTLSIQQFTLILLAQDWLQVALENCNQNEKRIACDSITALNCHTGWISCGCSNMWLYVANRLFSSFSPDSSSFPRRLTAHGNTAPRYLLFITVSLTHSGNRSCKRCSKDLIFHHNIPSPSKKKIGHIGRVTYSIFSTTISKVTILQKWSEAKHSHTNHLVHSHTSCFLIEWV